LNVAYNGTSSVVELSDYANFFLAFVVRAANRAAIHEAKNKPEAKRMFITKLDIVEHLKADSDTVVTTLDKVYEMALCICHCELSEAETIDYVGAFMQEFVESPR
jgi:hypothetical protein